MLEIRHLRHLIAIVDHGGLEKAAEALHLTQPALTKSLRRMEALLGVPVVERAGRRLVLTEIGADILADGRRLVQDADEVERRARLWREGGAGRVTVGVGPAVQAGVVPDVLTRLSGDAALEGALLIETGHADNLLPRLMAGSLDFAVYDFDVDPHDPDLMATPLAPEPVAAMVRAGHPFTETPPKSTEDLRSYSIGTVPAPPGLRQAADDMIRQMGTGMTLECDNYDSLAEVALSGDMVVLAPDRVIARLARHRPLVAVSLAFMAMTTRPQIIRRRHRPQSPLSLRLMKLFEDVAG
ncbi:LysR family transcriptional regulator [Kordiimonas marina]|uniref:LysR family transcriptional regulator n=1 Tax=Kordiimonas marina TaxID=2872312 RepID=UPI001FF5C482|nr:LysR family transcriptional regulator [Kordiimonas marina]MCJ9429751.1 LysR family transcriptional regulator [Kordiimonas marina]